VITIDSDGSLLLDTSGLVTLADVNPGNLLVLVLDNQSYARMGPTATARSADLEKMAQGAGIKKTATITSIGQFEMMVKPALETSELSFFVLKSESGRTRIKVDPRLIHGRPMLENFITAVRSHPDYQGNLSESSD